jgi:hypothetical protein
MRILLLIVLFLSFASAGWWSDAKKWAELKAYNIAMTKLGFPTNDDCGFTRRNALKCIKKYVDTNHDGEISAKEFNYVKENYMPEPVHRLQHYLKKLPKSWHVDITLDMIKEKCDANKDGRFTAQDWLDSKKTCLPHKADLCKLQRVCEIAAKKKNQL